VAGGCGTFLEGVSAAVAVAEGSDAPAVVSAALDAAVFAGAATGALSSVVFGTGTVAPTAAVNARSVAAAAAVCVAGCFTAPATAALAGACTAIFAVAAGPVVGLTEDELAAADTVTPAAADAVTAAAPESLFVWIGDAAADAGELAAIAAVAIASEGAALPDAGVAGGIFVAAMAMGIATAIGFGVAAEAASCCAGTAATNKGSGADEAPGVEAVSEANFSAGFFCVGCAMPAVRAVDLAPDCLAASVLALAATLASERCRAVTSPWSELFPAAWPAGAGSRDRLPSAATDASSARRCDADCCCAVAFARSLPASASPLLSISAWKSLFPCDGSGFADFGGAAWKVTLAAASDVTLNTGGLWLELHLTISKDRAITLLKKLPDVSIA
jgi:trimeric autotransporter adhesin